MTKPKVSAVTITYGHEDFIIETMNGVLMQQYDGPIEFIIANDNSPDNTDEVIRKYLAEKEIPEHIEVKYTRHTKNKGMISNFVWSLEQATGKYVAVCEGDDYWTDPLKLQKQVDFLENNPDYNICFHKAREINNNSTPILDNAAEDSSYSLSDLAKGNFIHTPTVMYRKVFSKFPEWVRSAPIGDYPLLMLNAEKGKIKYLNEEMGIYRVGSGIWSSQSDLYRIRNTQITLYLLMNHFIENSEIKNILKERIDFYNVRCETIIKDEIFANLPSYAGKISIRNAIGLLKRKVFDKLR